MTVNNDIDDDSATKHGDYHSECLIEECLIEETSFRRELLHVGTPLINMVVYVQITNTTIRIRPLLLFLHFAEDRFISGNQVKPTRSETSLNQSLRIRLVRQSATMQVVPIHLTMWG